MKKKLLCRNIIENNACKYDKNCIYAHSLDEQIMDPKKREILNIIKNISVGKYKNAENLRNMNVYKNKDIFKIFLEFTKICDDCKNNKCKGGLNCKKGIRDEKLLICMVDLINGSCNNIKCNIHLSKYGLTPFNIKKKEALAANNIYDENDDNNSETSELYSDSYTSSDSDKSIFS